MPRTPRQPLAKVNPDAMLTPAQRSAKRARARKVTKPACKFCDQPAEFGVTCDACTERLNQHEALYLAGLSGNAEARKALKKLSAAERQQIAPTLLSEDDLDAFINRGVITGRHQVTQRQIKKLFTTTSQEDKIMTKSVDTPAPAKTSTRKRPASTRKAAAPAVEATVAKALSPKAKTSASALTAAQVARDASIDGRAFRKFLRSKSLKPSTKAEFTKAVAAFKKEAAK